MISDDRLRFEALYALHQRTVWAYVRRRADPDAVEDAVAETFLVAWRRLEDLPGDELPFLLGTARRVLANQRRSTRRAGALASRVAGQTATSVPDPSVGVDEADAVRAAVGRLGDQDREALTLVAWEGLEPAQAAKAAGCSTPTFAVRLHRARRRLSTELERMSFPTLADPSPEVLR